MDARKMGRAYSAGMLIGIFGFSLAMAAAGCNGRPSLLPNSDVQLRKTSVQFAADAAKRHYPAEAPRGGQAFARAQYGLMLRQLEVVNLSGEDWTNVEVWVNRRYVVFVPDMPHATTRTLNFQMIFNDNGQNFSTEGGKNPITTVELFKDGKVYAVPAYQAD